MRITLVLLVCGCSDYELFGKPDAETPPDTGSTEPPAATTPPPPPPASCDDFDLPVFGWLGSSPFATAADPADASGIPFWDFGYDTYGWTGVVTPDLTIPIGTDRAYVATFDVPVIPTNLSLDLESDDGIAVWVNGVEVGRWGGGWQMEGCVNEHANCLVTTPVDPVDVTPLLIEGPNRIAARVSNPVLNSYFDIVPACVD